MEFLTSTALYNFLRFYLVWIAFIVFIGGSIYRVYTLIDLAKKEKVILPFISLKATLRSLLHWLIPFASRRLEIETCVYNCNFSFSYLSGFYSYISPFA